MQNVHARRFLNFKRHSIFKSKDSEADLSIIDSSRNDETRGNYQHNLHGNDKSIMQQTINKLDQLIFNEGKSGANQSNGKARVQDRSSRIAKKQAP